MTDEEWSVTRRTLLAGWPVSRDGIDERAYRELLNVFPHEDVQAALRSMMGQGKAFLPKVNEIIEAIPKKARPEPPPSPTRRIDGDVTKRVPTPPWLIGDREFYPDMDTLVMFVRTHGRDGRLIHVASCAGFWDTPDGDVTEWESWNVELLSSARIQEAA